MTDKDAEEKYLQGIYRTHKRSASAFTTIGVFSTVARGTSGIASIEQPSKTYREMQIGFCWGATFTFAMAVAFAGYARKTQRRISAHNAKPPELSS